MRLHCMQRTQTELIRAETNLQRSEMFQLKWSKNLFPSFISVPASFYQPTLSSISQSLLNKFLLASKKGQQSSECPKKFTAFSIDHTTWQQLSTALFVISTPEKKVSKVLLRLYRRRSWFTDFKVFFFLRLFRMVSKSFYFVYSKARER